MPGGPAELPQTVHVKRAVAESDAPTAKQVGAGKAGHEAARLEERDAQARAPKVTGHGDPRRARADDAHVRLDQSPRFQLPRVEEHRLLHLLRANPDGRFEASIPHQDPV
jgi:hypothetical protein